MSTVVGRLGRLLSLIAAGSLLGSLLAAAPLAHAEDPVPTVTGRVLADDPSGVEVTLCPWRDGYFDCDDEQIQTAADDQGRYSFRSEQLGAGVSYAIRFAHDDDRYWEEWFGGGRPESPEPGNHIVDSGFPVPDVTLSSIRRLTGTVVDSTGAPVPDVWVGLYLTTEHLADDDAAAGDETDADGVFRIRIPRAADHFDYVLAAWPEDGDPVTRDVTLSQADHHLDEPISLPSVVLAVATGRVLDAAGDPLPEISVVALIWEGDEDGGYFQRHRYTSTGADGSYAVRVKPGKRFTVRYEFSGYFTRYLGDVDVEPTRGDDPIATRLAAPAGEANPALPDVHLQQAHSVRGVVTAPGGEPVERVRVRAFPVGQRDQAAQWDVDGTDDEGRFYLSLPAGSHDLVFDVARSRPMVSGAVRTVTVPETTDLGAITLPYGGHRISGRVISSAGAAVSKATVRAYLWETRELSGDAEDAFWENSESTAVTDAEGRFSLLVGEGAVFTVRVQRSGYQLGWLGSLLAPPAAPDSQVSAVSAAGLQLPDITVFPSDARVGKVAGQDLDYCYDNSVQANDDQSSAAVPIPFPLRFFGQPQQNLYVNNNGNISFERPLGQYTPGDLTAPEQEAPIIAAFFADVDTRNAASFEATYGSSPDGKTICVNWANVGYFSRAADKLNIFQLLLTSRNGAAGRSEGDFDVTMNYDQIQWETGDASDGDGGAGGVSAGVGYSAGTGDPGTFFELDGSRVPGSFLDGGGRALVGSRLNSGQLGRYRYEIRNADAAVRLGGLRGSLMKDGDGAAVSGATVNACRIVDGRAVRCQWTTSLADGSYAFATLPAGDYEVEVSPPGALHAVTLTTAVGVDQVADLGVTKLTAPTPIPAGASLTSLSLDGGVPVVDYSQDLRLTVPNPCTAGTPTGAWKVLTATGGVHRSGALTPSGASLLATIPKLSPYSGSGRVVTEVACDGTAAASPAFDIYIDPSGAVYDQYGAPASGAKVTLLRADTAEEAPTAVPDGSTLMSPGNRTNPAVTDGEGVFHWDVVAGWYQLKVEKAGCGAYTSPLMEVPPERIDLAFRLTCDTPSLTRGLSIGGTAKVDSTLTASVAEAPGLSSTLRWLRDGTEVGSGASHLVTPADSGATLTVEQTLKADPVTNRLDGSVLTFEPLVLTASVQVEKATVWGAKPTVSGLAKVGATLTADPGAWVPAPVTLRYEWLRDGQVIPDASATGYRVTSADVGARLSVRVTGSRDGYLPAAQTSEPTGAVEPEILPLTPGTPTVTGKAVLGAALTVAPGSWGPASVSLGYQWLRGGAVIPGATKASYTLGLTDYAGAISVRVTGSKAGYATASKEVVAVPAGKVTGTKFAKTQAPTVSGQAVVGSKLTAKVKAWKPKVAGYAFQWLRNGKPIPGADKSSYVVQVADAGATLKVRVTGLKLGYAPTAKDSKATKKVPTPKVSAGKVSISGAAKLGATLKAKAEGWKPSPVTLAYQWLRSGKAIPGATGASHQLAAADVGKTITVKVTGSKAGYAKVAKTSKKTKKVAPGSLSAATPRVSGVAKLGQTLTANPGSWGPAPVTLKYQWHRSGKAIKKATKSTYTVAPADLGKKISVKVTGSKAGYRTVTRGSAATGSVVK